MLGTSSSRRAICPARSSPSTKAWRSETDWPSPIRATASAQHDLATSYGRVADVQLAQGDVAHALEAYSAARAILERLAKSDASNSRWQRDLSVMDERLGDVLMAQGDLTGALKSYTDCQAIRERLLQSDPGNADWQRDLADAYVKIGEVQSAKGDLAGALGSFRTSLATFQRLAASQPDVATWQRDVSVALNDIGDVLTVAGRRRRRAVVLSRQSRHRETTGKVRSQQHRLAARPSRHLEQCRRRGGRTGRSCRRVRRL